MASGQAERRGSLMPFLLDRLRRGDNPCVKWSSRELREFQVLWKRLGKNGTYPDDDFQLFRQWAMHQGHYEPATCDVNPEKWKANFRNALAKSKEFEEVKSKRHTEGPEPYRMYRFIKEIADGIFDMPGGLPVDPSPQPAISMNSRQTMGMDPNLDSVDEMDDLGGVPEASQEWAPVPAAVGSTAGQGPSSPAVPSVIETFDGQNTQNRMLLSVCYCNVPVLNIWITSPAGCRLSHGKSEELPGKLSAWLSREEEPTFGARNKQEVSFPVFSIPPNAEIMPRLQPEDLERKEKRGRKLLEGFFRGLELTEMNGDLYAKRLCKSAIFYASHTTNAEPVKLEREKRNISPSPSKIFDFNHFMESVRGGGTLPHPFVYLSIGEKFSPNMCITVWLASGRALEVHSGDDPNFMDKFHQTLNAGQSGIDASKTDTLDDYASVVRRMANISIKDQDKPMEFDESLLE